MKKLLCVIFACFFCLFTRATEPIELHIKKAGNSYQLMWIPKSWNADWQGVLVGYRLTGASTWTIWNDSPIEPGIYPQRNFQTQGLNPARQLSLENNFGEFIRINNMPPSVFRNALTSAEEGLPPREILCMHKNFDCALSMGLGAIVTVQNIVGVYEFALFPALQNGQTGNTPAAFHSTKDRTTDLLGNITYSVTGRINAIRMDWKLPINLYRDCKIFGFNIYHIADGSIKLLHEAVGNLPISGDTVHYAFTFDTNKSREPHKFSIAPITMFKEELVHIQIEYTPEPAEDKRRITAEFQLPVSNSAEGNPVLNIQTDKLPEKTKKLHVERHHAVSGQFQRIAQNLLPQTVSWTDTEPLDFGVSYTYRLVAVLDSEGEVYSNTQTVVNLGSPKPPPVNNVTAELVRRGDQVFASLRWQPLLHHKPAIKGYRILSDVYEPGQFVLHSNIPVISGNQFNFPLTGSFSNKNVTFQVVAITELSQSGDEGGFAALKIPALNLPPPSGFTIAGIDGYDLQLSWDYNDTRIFDGFEIEVNGQRIADARQIPSNSRSFTIKNLRPDSRGHVSIDLYAINSVSKSSAANISRGMPDYFLIPGFKKPEGVTVKKTEINGELYAEFSWKKSPSEFGGQAFALYSDVYTPGRTTPLSSIPLMTNSPYRYKLPDTDRDQYLFEVKAVDRNNVRGPGLQLILSLN